MKNSEPGYVYILTNPSFREDWVKIGKSSRPVDVRSKELDNTPVPLPFEIFATMKTVKYNEVEKLVHKTIDRLTDLRIRQNREFFNVALLTYDYIKLHRSFCFFCLFSFCHFFIAASFNLSCLSN